MNRYYIVFGEIIEKYKSFSEVVAIAIGGSGANKTSDALSDIDVYVFVEKEIPIRNRKEFIIEQLLISETKETLYVLDKIYENLKNIL